MASVEILADLHIFNKSLIFLSRKLLVSIQTMSAVRLHAMARNKHYGDNAVNRYWEIMMHLPSRVSYHCVMSKDCLFELEGSNVLYSFTFCVCCLLIA